MKGNLLVALAAMAVSSAVSADPVDVFATKADYLNGVLTTIDLEAASTRGGGGPTCATPAVIDSLPFNASDDTTGDANTIGTIPLACNSNYTSVQGPDHVYEIELGSSNNVTFSLTTPNADYDPSIYLASTCGDGNSCVQGADDCFAENAGGNPCGAVSDESFSVNDLAPGTYYFYVDSFYSVGNVRSEGPYDLEVTGTLGAFPRSIGGTVTGLAGSGLVLQNNGGDDLAIAGDGPFTFDTPVNDGEDYEVTVLTQPSDPGQVCTVTNGTGTVSGEDVTDIEVECVTDTYTVGGTVSGLAGSGLVLQNNGGDDLAIAGDGPFTFDTPVNDGGDYEVTVLTQPSDPGQVCTVTNGTGTVSGADVTDIEVDCVTDTYTVGGTVSGLQAGSEVVLQNNGGDDLAVDTDGPFVFGTPVDDGSDYEVTILTQPADPLEICTVMSGSGTVAGADVTDVGVDCELLAPEVFEDRFEQASP